MKMFRKIRGKKGFTLVEMLLVIAILMILMAFAVPGFSAYTKRIKLMELDDSARSIFMAAQNRLVTLKSAGADSFEFEGSQPITFDQIPEIFFADDADLTKAKDGDVLLRYITSSAARISGDDDGEKNILNLSSGVIEGELANENNDFIIVYDYRTGFVCCVLYAEDKTTLGGFDLKELFENGYDNIDTRLKEGKNFGYYGINELNHGDVETEFPADKALEVTSGGSSSKEKLAQKIENNTNERQYFYLTITGYDYRARKNPGEKENYKHTIAIIPKYTEEDLDEDKKKDVNYENYGCYLDPYSSCTICLDSIAPGKSADTTNEDGFGWILPDNATDEYAKENKILTRYTKEDGHNLSGFVMERDFKGWVLADCFKSAGTSFDPNSTSTPLEEIYETKDYVNAAGGENVKCFVHFDKDISIENTYSWNRNMYDGKINNDANADCSIKSIYYIIDPGTDITIEYGFYDERGWTKEGTKQTVTLNSYFAEPLNDGTVAKITSGRHLQNLAFYTYSNLLTKAIITETIDFSIDRTGEEDCYDYWNSAETNKGTDRAKNLYDFVPVDNLWVDDSKMPDITAEPGVEIRYIRIDSTTYNDGKDDTIETFTAKNHEYAGFFSRMYNRTMRDLTFYCPVVISKSQYTGTVFGMVESGSKFSNITVINPIVEVVDDGESDKELYVGGIGGQWNHDQTPSGNKVYVEAVDHYFDNYNYFYKNDNTKPEENDPIKWGDPNSDPYSYFAIKCNDPDGYAGGLLGSAEAPVMGASASVRVESKGYAGGLVGKLNSSVNNSYVAGHTYNGTFIGRSEIGGKDYVLQNIYGEKAAGGVAGYVVYNGAVDEKNNPVGHGLVSTYTTCSVASESPENADTFAGDGPYSTSNNSYALGYVISDGKIAIKKIDDTSVTGDDLLDRMIHGHRAAATLPKTAAQLAGNNVKYKEYDDTIRKYLQSEYYPYFSPTDFHYGDWPCGAPIVGMFYWEKLDDGKVDDGKVNYHAIYYNGEAGKTNEEIVKEHPELSDYYALNTLDSDAETVVTDFGYGYFYTDAAGVGGSLMDGVGENCDAEIISEIIKPLTQSVGTAVNVVCKKTSGTNSVHGARVLPFTCGESTVKFCYSPDYYGLEYVAESENLGKDGTPYHVRSAKQFDNIRNALDGVFAVDKNVTLGTAEAGFKPIGSLSGYFTGKVDGGGKTITVNYIDVSNTNAIGVFGVTRGATLSNLNVSTYTYDTVDIVKKGETTGIGGIVGIAIGGTISDCTVLNYSYRIAGENMADIAFGCVAGYSSAEIIDCNISGSISFAREALLTKGHVYAVGGIAGSASGVIKDCNSNFYSDFTNNVGTESTADSSFVIAGGIVGNNVDYLGQTVLTVDHCTSTSRLVRGSQGHKTVKLFEDGVENGTAEVRTVNVFENAIIHPIAPDKLVIENNSNLYFDNGEETSKETSEGVTEGASEEIGGETSGKWGWDTVFPNSDKVELLTGTGVDASDNLTVTITNCTFKQGWYAYDSQIVGESFNNTENGNTYSIEDYSKDKVGTDKVSNRYTSLDDVYTVPPVSKIPTVTYTKKAPTVGIYSLYEKSSDTGSEIVAKAFTTSEANRTLDLSGDVSSGDCDKLGRYGIITDLGRIDDPDLIITVDGNRITLPGQVYTVESVNPALKPNTKQYYDFSEFTFDEPGEHTIHITYNEIEILAETKINITERAPYFGVYNSVKDKSTPSGQYVNSVDMKPVDMPKEEGETISAGVMVEHSVAAPRTLDELTVTVNIVDEEGEPITDTSLAIYDGKTLSASDFAPAQTGYSYTAYGKKFDYYELKPEIFNAIPEGATVTLTAKPTKFDGPELKTEFTKPIKRPVLGVFAEYKVWNRDDPDNPYQMQVAAAKVVDGEQNTVTYNKLEGYIQEGKEFVGYGVMIQEGFDLDKLTIKLLYDGDKTGTITIDDTFTAVTGYCVLGDTYYAVLQYNSDKCAGYLIPDKLLENVKGIELSYQCAAKVAQTVSADFKKELKSETIGHTHSAPENAWHSDETSHWYECDDENCPDGKGTKFDIANHEFGEWVVTVEPEEHKTGLKVCVCEICGREKTEEIPEHKHEVDDTWETDENNHWKHCTDPECPMGTDNKVYVTAHTFGEWEQSGEEDHKHTCTICNYTYTEHHHYTERIITEPTPETPGEKELTCKECGKTKRETIPATGDVSNLPWGGVFRIYKCTRTDWGGAVYYKGVLRTVNLKNQYDGSFNSYDKDTQSSDEIGMYTDEKLFGILIENNYDISKVIVKVDSEPVEIRSGNYNIAQGTWAWKAQPANSQIRFYNLNMELTGDEVIELYYGEVKLVSATVSELVMEYE